MKILLSPLLFPEVKVEYFIIREETRKRYDDTLVISKDNIIHQWQKYVETYSQFFKYIYVKSRYGILKGGQERFNQIGKIDFRYKIVAVFDTEMEVFLDYIQLEKSTTFQSNMHFELASDTNNQKIVYEAFNDKPGNLIGYTDQFKGTEWVGCKASDILILNFDTQFVNNLGVKFQIQCRELYCNQKWIKYKGKIYRAVCYHTNHFTILNSKGNYIGIRNVTKSKYMIETEANRSIPAKRDEMNMKRLWFLDEQLGGLSVRKYRQLRRYLVKAYKNNKPLSFISVSTFEKLKQLGDKEYRIDPSIHLYMDEVLRDITLEDIHGV